MKKRDKIIYWIATVWLALGMVSTGGAQVFGLKTGAGGLDSVLRIGFPAYILPLIGTMKILGVIVVLLPKLPILKEWAYAGFVFVMAGAIYGHIYTGLDMQFIIPSALLLVLSLLSWYFRPASRKIETSVRK